MSQPQDPRMSVGASVIELEIAIQAPIERVWKALVSETGRWWRRDFLTDPTALTFVIEPVLGGKMYEDWGNGEGLVWATVTGIKTPNRLELAGVSSAAWGGPNTHYHSFHLEQQGTHTIVRFSDAVHGRIDQATATSLREGWALLLDTGLRAYCDAKPLS